MGDASDNWWQVVAMSVKGWRARHHMGTFDAKDFCVSLAFGTLIALALGWIILDQPKDSQNVHYAPLVGVILGFAIGNAVGDTDVWYSRDWFPPINEYLRRAVMALFVGLGGCVGVLVEAVCGVGVR
jgi:hypothetical protein